MSLLLNLIACVVAETILLTAFSTLIGFNKDIELGERFRRRLPLMSCIGIPFGCFFWLNQEVVVDGQCMTLWETLEQSTMVYMLLLVPFCCLTVWLLLKWLTGDRSPFVRCKYSRTTEIKVYRVEDEAAEPATVKSKIKTTVQPRNEVIMAKQRVRTQALFDLFDDPDLPKNSSAEDWAKLAIQRGLLRTDYDAIESNAEQRTHTGKEVATKRMLSKEEQDYLNEIQQNLANMRTDDKWIDKDRESWMDATMDKKPCIGKDGFGWR